MFLTCLISGNLRIESSNNFFSVNLSKQYVLDKVVVVFGGLVAKLCPTFCNPMDCSLPESSVHGISQNIPFSPGDCPNPGIEPTATALQEDSLLLSHQGIP